MQVRFGLKVVLESWIVDFLLLWPFDLWKVTSLSSTASVLRECKISLKFQEFIQKNFFFQNIKIGDSSLYIIDFKTLSGSENFSGLIDLNRHDNITGLNDLNSLLGL